MMHIRGTTATLRIALPDAGAAARLARALAVDDAGQADIRAEGRVLVVSASAASALGLLRTLDDVLGCARAAEPSL